MADCPVLAMLLIDFGDPDATPEAISDGQIELTLDDRPGGHYAGKPDPVQGDIVWVLAYLGGRQITEAWTTAGVPIYTEDGQAAAGAALSPALVAVDAEQDVVDQVSVTLNHTPVGAVSAVWAGQYLGAPPAAIDGRIVRFLANGQPIESTGILRTQYATEAVPLRLGPVPLGVAKLIVRIAAE